MLILNIRPEPKYKRLNESVNRYIFRYKNGLSVIGTGLVTENDLN